MAVTSTSELADSVVSAHLQTDFLIATLAKEQWDQFAWIPEDGVMAPGTDKTATSQQIVIYKNLDAATSTISETTDIVGVNAADTSISVSVGEYGNAVQDTKKLVALARTDIPSAITELVSRNASASQDLLARAQYIGGPVYRRPNGGTRAQLDTTADDLEVAGGWNFLFSGVAQLRASGAPGLGQASSQVGRTQGASEPGVDYGTVVHDLVIGEMQGLGGWTPVMYASAPDARQMLYNGECAKMAGIRIIESPLGKVYQSAGTVAQAATSLSAAADAGATSVVLTSGTGAAAGDYWTLGTLETGTTETTDLETVLVTSVQSTTTLHFQAAGAEGGLRYAHAADAAATEAVFVGAIPIFGGMSVAKAHSSVTGPHPLMTKTGPFDKLGRFLNYGWYWLGGYGRTVPTWLMRLEVALNGKCIEKYGP